MMIREKMNNLSNILFVIAGILWGIELIPQILKTIKRKSVDDISLFFFCLCMTAYLIYFCGATLIQKYILIVAHIPSFLLGIIMIFLIIKYRRKK